MRALFLAFVLFFSASASALANDAKAVTAGDLQISAAWARASVSTAGAAYLTITNTGTADDVLTGASTGIAGRAELHQHLMDGGVMRMRPVEGGVVIPAGQTVVLKPGGLHVMLMGLTEPFDQGKIFALTLTFKTAGTVAIEVPILPITASGPPE